MRSKFLLGVATFSLVASAAVAGELTVGSTGKISIEALKKAKLNNTEIKVAIDGNMTYIPTGIPAGSLSNPTLNIVFSEGAINSDTSGIDLCEVNSTGGLTGILNFDHVDTANNGLVLKAISNDKTMGNSKKYILCNKNGTDYDSLENNASITKLALKGDDLTSPVGIEFKLYSGDSQALNDQASGTLYTKDYEVCLGVISKADALIDPATGFVAFGGSTATSGDFCDGVTSTTNLEKTDKIVLGIKDKKGDFKYPISDYNVTTEIIPSKAIPIDVTNTQFGATAGGNASKDDINSTYISGRVAVNGLDLDATTDINATWTLAVNGTDKISDVTFKANMGVDLDADGTADIDQRADLDAGAWIYKGKTVKMPYVVSSADTQTAIRLTNGANVNADVYWSCIDDNGVEVSNILVNSADQGNSYVPANGAAAWLARDILAAAQAKNPDFAANGKMKCTPLVTSTNGVDGVVIMTINGARDRVLPTETN